PAVGGHLVSYTSQEEIDAVKPLLGANPHWMGLWKNGEVNFASWVTWERVSIAPWGPGQPNTANSSPVVAEHHLAGNVVVWANDQPYGNPLAYICEEDGWFFDRSTNHAYRTYYDPLPWPIAKQSCQPR